MSTVGRAPQNGLGIMERSKVVRQTLRGSVGHEMRESILPPKSQAMNTAGSARYYPCRPNGLTERLIQTDDARRDFFSFSSRASGLVTR